MQNWRLPENFSDGLPSEARAIEDLRRNLLDLYRSYGYELVAPPLIEHLDSLLTGTARDLDLQTFKLVDQLSGRSLALRSDMTPQVARIDAHLLNRKGVARLCYTGSVVHTRPRGFFSNREPIQIGAELYGHSGLEADIEVLELMLASLKASGAEHVRVDLSHHGIIAELMEELSRESASAQQASIDEAELFSMLQTKDNPGLQHLLKGRSNASAWLAVTALYGAIVGPGRDEQENILELARQQLPTTPKISQALNDIERLTRAPQLLRFPEVTLAIDLADVRGYRYHNGITFSAWVEQAPDAIARGGRYDNIGASFGRPRPATGFSLELREMARLWAEASGAVSRAILAPWSDDPRLGQEVAKLRVAGQIVVQSLPGHENEQQEFVFDRELQLNNGNWVVVQR